ncbi:CPBP family intramembrane metalloprotease [Pontibacter sp. JH31]|uniref:CPBP family intramembrane metalloprotease n=1 Tax=Pontibacter aquaedesilientis TaxID=2766980 RepID=A0ABR7XGV1_9BACT|nr:type II CAAX endopeptidase family protein [Pontibacter aquaedesilientis]MBD1397491.1 CPBP family intramembrane metalloprotease [Pontibacter aquaedesilientis]
MATTPLRQRVLTAPITKILLVIIVCFIVFVISQKLTSTILDTTAIDRNFRNLIKGIIASTVVVYTYILFYKKIEKRSITELSIRHLAKSVFLGVVIGAVLQCFTILVVSLFGDFQILAVNPFSYMIIPFTVAFTVAIFEEILMRGIILRITEEKLGSYIALTISAVIFGLVHLANPNSTLISGLSVVVAGFLFGVAYIYTRNLWFPIAIHFAWNFMQSGVFGAVTSGNEKTNSLLTTELSGNQFITGGEFGPEGSIQAIVFCLLATIILFLISRKNLIKPYWRK